MSLLYQLIRISLGISSGESFPLLDEAAWLVLKEDAVKHTLTGIAWGGIEQLPQEKQPPRRVKLLWIADVEVMKRHNQRMNKACKKVTQMLENASMPCAILKGQAVAQLYPNPLYRTSGDIDALILPEYFATTGQDIDHSVKSILKKLRSIGKGKIRKTVYHHTEWIFTDVTVEVHYRSMQFNNPFSNRAYQQWAKGIKTISAEGFLMPDTAYNIVFLLAHLYHHLLFEGVGLRQVCDYVVLLLSVANQFPAMEERNALYKEAEKHIKACGMQRFASGMMWIMQTVFCLPTDLLLCETDEQTGRFILGEIEQAGNFGKYDERIDHQQLSSTIGRFLVRTKHRMRFLLRFPSEIVWDIPFRLWHYCWRRRFS
ncbi:MAG: nucleotidyltransferase family protein [Bacteroidaceae bacterium]|nr:nucleotidyltransferase family protein [Bacteroidaceae bacterium]